jgi:hypothetical protein
MTTRIPISDCGCESPDHHGSLDKRYYVTVINDTGTGCVFAAGPYDTHREAQARVREVTRLVHERYYRKAPWYSYGTSGEPITAPVRQTEFGTLT